MVKQYIKQVVEEEESKPKFQSRRNAKLLDKKPPGAIRVLADSRPKSNRPLNIYKETVADDEDDGDLKTVLWYHTEQSQYIGKEEIVRYNEKTQEELTLGFDYTIPFTIEKARELMKMAFGRTTFYTKDNDVTYVIKKPDLELLFLGITPKGTKK